MGLVMEVAMAVVIRPTSRRPPRALVGAALTPWARAQAQAQARTQARARAQAVAEAAEAAAVLTAAAVAAGQ